MTFMRSRAGHCRVFPVRREVDEAVVDGIHRHYRGLADFGRLDSHPGVSLLAATASIADITAGLRVAIAQARREPVLGLPRPGSHPTPSTSN